ncbi:DinB family protein [Bacillus swezeyi]|uniref:DinB family protein n=1 Tax=Bacillus swezeyi TaxID=1925020 RepID=UPI0027DE6254|nr:DinB family protein [Bacillus swezeyi]
MERKTRIVQDFLSHRTVTEELIGRIAEKHTDYKPTETSMSARELVTHMLYSFYQFARTAKEGNPEALKKKMEETETSLAELAQTYTEKTKELLESFTDEELDREIDLTNMFGQKVTAEQLLQFVIGHEIHHKGNLFVYVREMGHTDLPLYVKLR